MGARWRRNKNYRNLQRLRKMQQLLAIIYGPPVPWIREDVPRGSLNKARDCTSEMAGQHRPPQNT